MKEIALLNDGSYLGWMVQHTSLKTSYTTQEQNINAGIKSYNAAIKQTEDDPEEETALETEGRLVEDALATKPKDYAAAERVTNTWPVLLPAIHAFYQTRRDFFKRTPGPDAGAEAAATERAAAITVKSGSPAAAFNSGKDQLDKCIREHAESQNQAALDAIANVPKLYGNTKYFTELKKNATAADPASRVNAHKQIATASSTLAGGQAAKDAIDAYKTNRATLPDVAQAILDAMVPSNAPAPITSAEAVETERKRIAAAKALQSAFETAKPYGEALKAVQALGKTPPPDLEKRHAAAVLPPKTVADFGPRTTLLEALLPLWQPAFDYAKALAGVQAKSDAVSRAGGDAGTKDKVQKAVAAAKKLAAEDKFEDAIGALTGIAADLGDRHKDVAERVKQAHAEAKQALDAHDAMVDSELKTLLAKLRKALPTIGPTTDLAEASRVMAPTVLLGTLVPLAVEYAAALETAEANWASLPVGGFSDARKAATTALKLPSDPLKFTPAMFEGPIRLLTTFNAQWEIGKKNQQTTRNLETRLGRLTQTRPEGGESYRTEEAAIRREFNEAKKLTGPATLKASAEALALVADRITDALARRFDVAEVELRKLTLDPAPKAVLDGIAAATDKSGRSLGVMLYLEFGRDLPKLLAALDKFPDDPDHAKAAKTLAAFGQHLGAGALQQLASDTCDDDVVKFAGVMVDVLQKGLGTGAPEEDNDKRLDNLKALADAFADSGKLSTLLRGLARGDAKKAGERMDYLLTRYFANDPKKLKTPFFDELEKGPTDVAYMIRQAVTFQRQDKPAAGELAIDGDELRDATVDEHGGRHFLNRHTRAYCAFTAENLPPTGKSATFWPEGTSNADIQKCLKDAVAALDPMPGTDAPGNKGDFVRRYVTLTYKGRSIKVQVGFEYTGPDTTKITQFFPLTGGSLVTLSPEELEAIGKALPKP